MRSGPNVQMDALKEATRDDPTAWRDYRSPKNRTYWWNEAKNSSGASTFEYICGRLNAHSFSGQRQRIFPVA